MGKGFFKVDLAATTAKAWNPFRNYRLLEMIPTPPIPKPFRTEKHIVFVVCMTDFWGGNRDSEGGERTEPLAQNIGVSATDFQLSRKLRE